MGRLDLAVESRLEETAAKDRIDALTQALERANAENAQLQETTDAVAHRLDAAIDRIRKILDD